MKIHTNNATRPYGNPHKSRRLTASERRGFEMVRGCRYDEQTGRSVEGWQR